MFIYAHCNIFYTFVSKLDGGFSMEEIVDNIVCVDYGDSLLSSYNIAYSISFVTHVMPYYNRFFNSLLTTYLLYNSTIYISYN